MVQKYFVALTLSLALFLSVGCNKTMPTPQPNITEPSSVLVSAFALEENKKVTGVDLTKVFFSIDINRFEIFNADSLPKGTLVDSLQIKMTFPQGAKSILRFYRRPNRNSTEYTLQEVNYSNDTHPFVDFSDTEKRPVTFEITSPNGELTVTYLLKVNVHRQNPLQARWFRSVTDGMEHTRVFLQNNTLVIKRATDLYSNTNLSTMQLLGQDVYAATYNYNQLCKGTTLIGNSYNFINLIGVWNNNLVGVCKQGNDYYHFLSPDGESLIFGDKIDPDFPIKGYSNSISFNAGGHQQIAFVGGRTQRDALTNGTWLFDGNQWANVAQGASYNPITPREGAALVVYQTGYNQITTRWFVLGGKNDFSFLKDIYLSSEYGIRWEKSPASMDTPASFGARAYASPVVGLVGLWGTTWNLEENETGLRSRPQVNPDAPYIYLFGGDISGANDGKPWRMTLNQLNSYPIE